MAAKWVHRLKFADPHATQRAQVVATAEFRIGWHAMNWVASANQFIRLVAYWACCSALLSTHAWAKTPEEFAADVAKAEAHLARFEVDRAVGTLNDRNVLPWECSGAEPFLRLRKLL